MNKDEMVNKVKAEIEEQEKNLENLKTKIVEKSDDLSSEFQKAIDDLEPKLKQANAKLSEIVDSADNQWDDLKGSLEEGWNENKKNFDEGWNNFSDSVKSFFSNDTKEAFLKKAQASIDEQQEKLEQLKQKGGEVAGDITEDYQKAIDYLESNIEHAKGKVAEISDAADHRWDDMKTSAEKGWDEAKNKFDEGFDNFTDSVKKLFS